jgi:hypothetical protein
MDSVSSDSLDMIVGEGASLGCRWFGFSEELTVLQGGGGGGGGAKF